jgi:acetate---CoA ligase (ADP-forming)
MANQSNQESAKGAARPRRPHDLPADLAAYSVEEVLRDGGSILIRAIRPDDKARLDEHFRGLSERSLYFRFMGMRRALGAAELARLTEPDFKDHAALVATLTEDGRERFIGVGRYLRGSNRARAEIAFAVLDAHQGRGIGTLLLEHLARIASVNGIDEFEADVLGDNKRMLDVFAQSGFRVRRSFESGTVHVYFPTGETTEFLAANLARERGAAAESVARLFAPHSVAVVGASHDLNKIGGALLGNLIRGRFAGPIYPINPAATEMQGLKCYPSVSAVCAPVELAVICVPPAAVEGVVADCARAKVHGAVVITSGFAESSAAGRAEQNRMVELARASGMRMVGPNCMGIINTDPAVNLNATFAPVTPPQGNVGMFSQSGAVGLVVLDYARARRIGMSTFISAGNRADVSSNDCLAYWAGDPRTQVILLYLESFGNPRRFVRIAPDTARQKPIVAVKAGRTAAGTRAASSHSAALANLDVAVEALFEQAGVIRANTLEEVFDVVMLLASEPLPRGPRIGVVTNAGGAGILCADACEAHGLKMPMLAAATLAELKSFLPERAGFANPIDMTASVPPADYLRTMRMVGNDPNVDAVVAIYIPPAVTQPAAVAAAIARGAGEVPADKPVLTVFLSSAGAPAALHEGPRGILPVYTFPENAALALSAANRYARWRERPRGTPLQLTPFSVSAIRSVIDRVLTGADQPRWLSAADIAVVLRAAGIEVAVAEQVAPGDAPAAAERIGFPIVAKVVAPGIVHKTEIGGVIMDLNSAAEVAAAVETLRERATAAGSRLEGVLLQREVRGGIEALVGVTTDPTFGPIVVCGMGGVLAELVKDVAFRLHPVSDVDAAEMLTGRRLARLLEGYRGAPPGDRDALIQVILRISALIEEVPELTELDLNPVKVLAPGKGAVVIDARIRVRPRSIRA